MTSASVSLHERLAQQEVKIEELTEKVDSLTDNVRELTDSIAHYKGFIGGVLFIFTCIGAFIKLVPINLGFGK